MAWLMLILAGLLEVVGAIGLKRTALRKSWPNYLILIGGFGASFLLLIRAMEEISLATAYAVWTGIGTFGAVLAGRILYKERLGLFKFACMAGIVGCVIGLRLIG